MIGTAWVNFFTGVGVVVQDAQFFVTHSGKPKVTFRAVFPRHPMLPHKGKNNGDYYTVVALGKPFVPYLSHLQTGSQVVVFGFAQSRDIEVRGEERTAYEIVAQALFLVQDPRELEAEDAD